MRTSSGHILGSLRENGRFMICNETDGSDPHDDVWTRRISEMRIYSGERMESDLREAGFRSVNVYRKDGRRWICVIARRRDCPGASENDMK